jgi:dUTP pyrophosphatase
MSENENSPHICLTCERSFKTLSALISHQRTHNNEIIEQHIDDTGEQFVVATEATNTMDHPPQSPLIIKIMKLEHGQMLPELRRATSGSAAVDLYAAVPEAGIWLGAHSFALVPTGIAMEIPPGYYGSVAPRSGLAADHGISIVNTPGIIDSDFRGQIKVNLINHSTTKFHITNKMRIAQIVFMKVEPFQFEYVSKLSETERGTGGFGSSGLF